MISRVKTQLEVRTPFVNAGLEGTEFVVRILEKATIVSVLEGRVAVSNTLGMLSLTAGQSAREQRFGSGADVGSRPRGCGSVGNSLSLIAHPESSGVGGEIARAQRLLMVGRAVEARGVLQALLDDASDDADALTMSAVIELAQNRKKPHCNWQRKLCMWHPDRLWLCLRSRSRNRHISVCMRQWKVLKQ